MTAGLHSQNFVGCIADLRLNEDPLDLMGNALDGRNVRPCEGWTRKRKWLQWKHTHRRVRSHAQRRSALRRARLLNKRRN